MIHPQRKWQSFSQPSVAAAGLTIGLCKKTKPYKDYGIDRKRENEREREFEWAKKSDINHFFFLLWNTRTKREREEEEEDLKRE